MDCCALAENDPAACGNELGTSFYDCFCIALVEWRLTRIAVAATPFAMPKVTIYHFNH